MVFLREQQKQARAARRRRRSSGIPMPRTRPRIRGFLSSDRRASGTPLLLPPPWSGLKHTHIKISSLLYANEDVCVWTCTVCVETDQKRKSCPRRWFRCTGTCTLRRCWHREQGARTPPPAPCTHPGLGETDDMERERETDDMEREKPCQ